VERNEKHSDEEKDEDEEDVEFNFEEEKKEEIDYEADYDMADHSKPEKEVSTQEELSFVNMVNELDKQEEEGKSPFKPVMAESNKPLSFIGPPPGFEDHPFGGARTFESQPPQKDEGAGGATNADFYNAFKSVSSLFSKPLFGALRDDEPIPGRSKFGFGLQLDEQEDEEEEGDSKEGEGFTPLDELRHGSRAYAPSSLFSDSPTRRQVFLRGNEQKK